MDKLKYIKLELADGSYTNSIPIAVDADQVSTSGGSNLATDLVQINNTNSAQQTQINNLLDDKADASSLSTVATTGSYNDLSNKPTIPTVNNATLTIQKNGTTVKTFTANASSNVTANITVPQVTDSYSASTTDSYSCNYVNEINDKLLKTENINLTINTDYVYSTDLDYTCIKIGNVVFLSINTIAFKVGDIPNDGVLLSNLPKPINEHIFLLIPRNTGNSLRVCIDKSGNLVSHYSYPPEYGDSANKQYGGTIIYFTND